MMVKLDKSTNKTVINAQGLREFFYQQMRYYVNKKDCYEPVGSHSFPEVHFSLNKHWLNAHSIFLAINLKLMSFRF